MHEECVQKPSATTNLKQPATFASTLRYLACTTLKKLHEMADKLLLPRLEAELVRVEEMSGVW